VRRASRTLRSVGKMFVKVGIIAAPTGRDLKLPVRRWRRSRVPCVRADRARGSAASDGGIQGLEGAAQGSPSRRPRTVSAVLTVGWEAAVELWPLYYAMFR
jgi:hypothetical protein